MPVTLLVVSNIIYVGKQCPKKDVIVLRSRGLWCLTYKSLRLRRANVEYSACFPEYFQDVRIILADLFIVPYKSSSFLEASHRNTCLDTNRNTVEGSNRGVMLVDILIELFCSGECPVRQKFENAIDLF